MSSKDTWAAKAPESSTESWSDARIVCDGMTAGEIRQALIRDVQNTRSKP